MLNMYTWRGRARKKRGTKPLARLAIQVSLSSSLSTESITLSHPIAAGTVSLTVGANTYKEPSPPDGTLIGTPAGTGTINYTTGVVIIFGGGSSAITGTYSYYPLLPVMGLRDFIPVNTPSNLTTSSIYPQSLAFDTKYSYQNFNNSSLGSMIYFNTTYFKNPPTGTYTSYVAKGTQTPFVWTGQDYQQFWTTNFEQALWATNANPGMQIQAITAIVRNTSTNVTLSVASSPAVIGDFVFINEVVNSADTPPSTTNADSLNNQSGYVTAVGVGTITVTLPNANVSATGTFSGGIVQYLTNVVPTLTSTSMGDGIKWYDGDPTGATGLPSGSAAGWVNFNPPLSKGGQIIDNYASGTKPFYLVGCKAILPYKDRILFFGCYISTSANAIAGIPPIFLQDTVIWSWNGSPYYTCSFAPPINTLTTFHPILTPGTGITNEVGEGANFQAYFTDQTGFGGYLAAGIQQAIVTVGLNEDVLIISFTRKQTRFAYTGNDIDPFRFYAINSELGASATFSAITLDRGVLTFGPFGLTMTTQTSTERIDLVIPDAAFQVQQLNYGTNRINSVRDYYKEWVYFSYSPDSQPTTSLFPTQTFLFNYRDNTWAILYENFTAHGNFASTADTTWATLPYNNWDEWTDPWNTPEDQALFPEVIAGNPQGFVVILSQGTGEAPTGNIANSIVYAADPTMTQITSTNHCVNEGDYLYISGVIGSTNLNGNIGQVSLVIDTNNFVIDIPFSWSISEITAGVTTTIELDIDPFTQHNFIVGETVIISGVGGMTELNGNTYTILSVTFDTITINVDSSGFTPYSGGGVVSATTYLGLGVYTRLIQPLLQSKQFPIAWQYGRKTRIGAQQYLFDFTPNGQVTVNLYLSQDPNTIWNAIPIVPDPNATNNSLIYSQLVYTCPESTNLGLTAPNTNLQMPTAGTQNQIWHRMNTSLIGDTVQFGVTLNDAQMRNLETATAEITLHAAVFDVSPSQMLS